MALMVQGKSVHRSINCVISLILFFGAGGFVYACEQKAPMSDREERVSFCLQKFGEYQKRLSDLQETTSWLNVERVEELHSFMASRREEQLSCNVDLGGMGGLSAVTQTENMSGFLKVESSAKALVQFAGAGAPTRILEKLASRLEESISTFRSSSEIFLNHKYELRESEAGNCR